MATATKPARNPRPKQKELPGMEQPKNAKIERLADDYVSARDARMELAKQESSKQTLLLMALKESKITLYKLPNGMVAGIDEGDEKAFVRKPKTLKSDK